MGRKAAKTTDVREQETLEEAAREAAEITGDEALAEAEEAAPPPAPPPAIAQAKADAIAAADPPAGPRVYGCDVPCPACKRTQSHCEGTARQKHATVRYRRCKCGCRFRTRQRHLEGAKEELMP